MEKSTKITIGVIFAVLLIAGIIFAYNYYSTQKNIPSKELTLCIANYSILYSQTGCTFCIKQEQMFGDNVNLLIGVDCAESSATCRLANISVTPTWIINGIEYRGVYTIKELKNMTGC